MIREQEEGYVRIGRYDEAGRRSTWVRLNKVASIPDVERDDRIFIPENYASIEICSGREGDDAYAIIDSSNPAFYSLLDVLCVSIGNLPENEDE